MTVPRVKRPRRKALVVLSVLVTCIATGQYIDTTEARAGGLAPGQARAATQVSAPPERWVAVSVATLWVRPGVARPVDRPAGANPVDLAKWLADMSVAQKRWLVGRLETQALYAERVYLLGTSGGWSKIAVPSQPSPRSSLGYPGWVPTRQLTSVPPVMAPSAGERMAVVRHRTAWLWATPELSRRVLQLSYGTRLAAVAWTSASVEVVTLDGTHLFVRRSTVALHAPGEPWPTVTGARLVREARRFAGLQYLWAGTAGFGFDCSGLTYVLHRALGKTIARDAGPQGARGQKVWTRSALRPGDLVFFRNASGRVHHVGMYVGDGNMIHSPHTGAPVRTTSIYLEPYFSEFAGGRRYWRAATE